MLCVGATFTVSRKHSRKFLYGDELQVGKIHSVVRRHGSSVAHFKFYNLLDYPDSTPVQGSCSYMYHECDKMLSTNEKKTGIKWTVKNTGARKSRSRTQYFQKEYSFANRGLYDKEDELDVLRRKKVEERQHNNEIEASCSSETDEDMPVCRSQKQRVHETSSSSSESEFDSKSECDSSDDERQFNSTKVTSVDLSTADYWIEEQW